MEYRENWLPHLNDAIPTRARGNNLSMYTIALEGFRRGLSLTFFSAYHDGRFEVQYSLSDGEKKHYFEISKGDLNNEKARDICKDKILSKETLKKQGIPVPDGRSFLADEKKEMTQFAKEIGYPVVVKPIDGKLGRGVVPNIKSETELLKSLDYVTGDLDYHHIMIEKHVTGSDFRLYVIGDRVVSAVQRVPAHIIGDGVHTVEQLIDLKNQERKHNPNTATRLIKKDKEVLQMIEQKGFTLDSVLDLDQRLYLREKCNISSGGESIDRTNILPDEIKNIAVQAVQSIPGLVQAGVDMIVDDKMKEAAIIEMNTRPGIGLHIFPSNGMAADVPKAIVDYYFPDTTRKHAADRIYFDFNKIYNTLISGVLEEVEVSPFEEEFVTEQTEVYGNVQTKKFNNWLMRNTLNLRLNGNAQYLSNGNVLITIQGKKENVQKFQKLIKEQVPFKLNQNTNQKVHLMKIGFEIVEK